MKFPLITLLAAAAMTAIASAAPQYLIESSVVRRSAKGTQMATAPNVVVKNGQQATIELGDLFHYAVIPEIRENGSVDLRVFLIESTNEKGTDKLSGSRVETTLGRDTTVRIGDHEFTAKTSLVK